MSPEDFLFIDEVKIMGYGESDTQGRWLKLQIDEDVLDAIRGLKGQMLEVGARLVDNDGERRSSKPQRGPYSATANYLYKSGFFNNPKVWPHLGTDKDYQQWCREHESGCVICGDPHVEYAHVRRVSRGSGIGIKPEYSGLPMCHEHHSLQHSRGELYVASTVDPSITSVDEAKEWFEKTSHELLTKWCHERIIDIFCVDSLTDISPKALQDWCEEHGIQATIK